MRALFPIPFGKWERASRLMALCFADSTIAPAPAARHRSGPPQRLETKRGKPRADKSFVTSLSLAAGIAIALTIAAPMAQLFHLWKIRSADGLSLSAITIGPAVSGMWFLYGISVKDFSLTFAYGTTTISGLATILLAYSLSHVPAVRPLCLALLWFTLLGAAMALGAGIVIAVVTGVITCVRPALQAWTSITTTRYRGLSVRAFILSTASCSLWLVHGFGTGEAVTVVTSGWCAACYAVVAARARILRSRAERSYAAVDGLSSVAAFRQSHRSVSELRS